MVVNIVYSSSDYYSQCTGISIYSLLKNNQDIPDIKIHILETGISERNKSKIYEIVKKFNREIEFIGAQEQFDEYVRRLSFKYMRGSYNTYARVMLNAWFSELDKVLLIDSDTLVVGSIEELWSTNMNGHLIGAVPEIAMYSPYSTYEDKKIVDASNPYFNMGIVLCNLKLWREKNIDNLIEEKLNNYKDDFKIADQSILNYLINSQMKRLHLKYNYYTSVHAVRYSTIKKVFSTNTIFDENEFQQARENPVIIHFVGHSFERPWFVNSISIYRNMYLSYREETPWKGQPLMNMPDPPNWVFGIYDKLTYMMLKLNLFDATHWFRYISAQRIKNLIRQSR
ncbi:MAG: glycosyltransferase family 8 protein [Eubacteriales bacterium]